MKTSIAFLFVLLVFTSCSIEKYKAIYDNNDSIKSITDSYYKKGSISTSIDDSYSIRIQSFSGIETLKTINKNGTLKINIMLNIESGQFKVVLVDENNIILICKETMDGVLDFSNIDDGKYRLRIVGVEAKISLKMLFLE